jgi:hypothetical protein
VRASRHAEHYTPVADYDLFASDYDAWSAETTEDVGWYVELARAAAEPIVELGIGKRRTFERVAAGLRPGGRFAFNVFAFSGAVAGLEVEGLYGGFHREPYDDSSLEMASVARKPDGRRLDGAREAELVAPPEAPR